MFTILQYSEIECNCEKKMTEGHTVRYDSIMYENLKTVENIVPLGRGPLILMP